MPLADRKILIVDDYRMMRRIIKNLLGQIGFPAGQVDEASDGVEALQKIREQKYDIVLCDWHMEPMHGYEVLSAVRKNPEIAKTPFIIVSAESNTKEIIRAQKLGITAYLLKPFNVATLREKLKKVKGFEDL